MANSTKSIKTKETGDNIWDEEGKTPRVTSASLIVPKEIANELFFPDGRISDKRLETIQYKCFCRFHLAKLPARNPGSKVCERVVVTYSYPTKNHQVTLRLFNELVQQCASALRIASMVKVSTVLHKPPPRAKSAASEGGKVAGFRLRPHFSGDVDCPTAPSEQERDRTSDAV